MRYLQYKGTSQRKLYHVSVGTVKGGFDMDENEKKILDAIKMKITNICFNRITGFMPDESFYEEVKIIAGWLQCEWIIGNVSTDKLDELRVYILETADYVRRG